jgi:hypothetical protein
LLFASDDAPAKEKGSSPLIVTRTAHGWRNASNNRNPHRGSPSRSLVAGQLPILGGKKLLLIRLGQRHLEIARIAGRSVEGANLPDSERNSEPPP